MKSLGIVLLSSALFFLLSAPLLAQSQATTGVIEGTIVDENGEPLGGVAIVVRNTATNFSQDHTTDNRGRFRGVLLPLGPYEVVASQEGLATLRRDGLELSVGQTISLRLEMRLSTVEQEIVVTARTPLIEISKTESSVRIDRNMIQGLPNNGRNFLEFAKLTPGVSIVQGPDGDELTINGQKGIQNNVSVDGADFNNPFFGEQRGGQRPAFTFNIDAVQEFVVVPDGAPAEFGRSSSGFINVVTKSGTNRTRGTAHLFFSDQDWASEAKRPGGGSEPGGDGDRQQIGFTLGGPVKQDKTFYFLAVDFQDGSNVKQNDPNRIEQRVVDAFAALGAPNENGPIAHGDDNFVGLAKMDWNANDNNLFTVRFNYTDTEQVNGTFDVDSWGVSANAIEKDSSWAPTLSLVSVFSSGLLNEARAQYAREDRPRPYDGATFTGTDRPFPDTAFDFGREYRFGMPFFIPVIYNDTRLQLVDNISLLRGDHTLKAGVEYNETSAFQTFIGFANGLYKFGSTDGFLNFLADPLYIECSDGSTNTTGACPAGTDPTGPVLLYLQQAGAGGRSVEEAGTQDIVQKEPAIFFQDTWQPKGNLTVQYGLRWEALIQPDLITAKQDLFYAPFIGQTVNGMEFPGDGTIPSDEDMLQPRLGISWDPTSDGRNVVRANAGIYYARIPGLNLASSRSTDGTRGQTLFRNHAASPFLGLPPAYDSLIPQSAVGDPFLPDVFVFDKDFENPNTFAAALSYERQVGDHWKLLFKYNYAKTENLTRFLNLNDANLGSPWSSGLAPAGINGINNLTTVESGAQSLYKGYTVGLEKRLSNNIQFSGFYTYSKDKSDDDNERDPFTYRYALITDLAAEWGYSDRDQRHRANAWVLWTAPHDINVSARWSYRSEQPKSITETGADAATPQDRINADGTVTTRNLGRKDNEFNTLDARVSKMFNVGGARLEAIVEVFNLFNSENLRKPQSGSLVFNFDGTVTSGLGDPRSIQLGVRYLF